VRATRQELDTEDIPVTGKSRKVSRSPRIASSSKRAVDNVLAAVVSAPIAKEVEPELKGGVSLIKTDDQVSFLVYGEPIALQRHRMLRSGMTYNPSSKQQNQFLDISKPFLPSTPLQGPLEVRLVFHFKRPLNHYGSGKNSQVLKEGMDIWHSKRKGTCKSDTNRVYRSARSEFVCGITTFVLHCISRRIKYCRYVFALCPSPCFPPL
jgi:hypothetical protein